MRKDARVEALSAITEVEGATAPEESWALDKGDTSSPTKALSALSGPAFDVTGSSDSSAL